jgi:hypothetical protein
MRAVAIKTGQMSGELRTGLQEMGVVRCYGCGEEFVIAHQPAFADRWVAPQQAHWLERSVRKSTSGKRNTPTGSNCRTEAIIATFPSLCRPFAILPFLPDVMRIFPSSCRDDLADLSRYR